MTIEEAAGKVKASHDWLVVLGYGEDVPHYDVRIMDGVMVIGASPSTVAQAAKDLCNIILDGHGCVVPGIYDFDVALSVARQLADSYGVTVAVDGTVTNVATGGEVDELRLEYYSGMLSSLMSLAASDGYTMSDLIRGMGR